MVRTKSSFTALVIGKRVVAATVAVFTVMLVVFCSAVALLSKYNKTDMHIKTVCTAVPLFGAQNTDFCQYFSKLIYTAFGIYPGEEIYNLKVLPCFATIDGEQSIQTSIIVPDVNEKTEPPVVKVSEQTNISKKLEIKNETTYSIDANALLNMPLDIEMSGKNPEILIVHTHGTESYTQSEKYNYSSKDNARCTDLNYNMIRVGDELTKELKSYGFNVVHDRTLNDYPSYNSSYAKTLEVIENYLQKYPSIKCVFDIHRDALEYEDGTKVKFTTQIDGKKVSQVMIVCGSDGLGLENPNWQHNLSLALKIQNCLNEKYPGFMRPVNLRKERFNMHKTKGSLIFEVGTHGNTLDEALGACKYLAEGIAQVLK